MQQYQKLALAAVAAALALSGCASRQPTTTAAATPPPQAAAQSGTGTVVSVQNKNAPVSSSTPGMASSGGPVASSSTSIGQMLIVQFENGKRETYHVAAGGQEFQPGDKVTVNTSQGTPMITRAGM